MQSQSENHHTDINSNTSHHRRSIKCKLCAEAIITVRLRGKKYHYQFEYEKQPYSGPCTDCTTEAKAKAFEQTVRDDLIQGTLLGPPQTLEHCLQHYINDIQSQKENTINREISVCNRLMGRQYHKKNPNSFKKVPGFSPQQHIHNHTVRRSYSLNQQETMFL